MIRDLTVGEHNAISHALFLRQEQLRLEAHRADKFAFEMEAKYGDEGASKAKQHAAILHEQARVVFNLELIVRRYQLKLESPIIIIELA